MELDIDTSDFYEEEREQQPIRIEVGAATNEVAESLVASMSSLAERMEASEERQGQFASMIERLISMMDSDRETLVAALGEMSEAVRAQASPVVHVDAPVIPEPNITVQAPDVHVTVEAPTTQRKVVVTRDPLTNLIAGAEVTDG